MIPSIPMPWPQIREWFKDDPHALNYCDLLEGGSKEAPHAVSRSGGRSYFHWPDGKGGWRTTRISTGASDANK